ncbi:PREDICTED: ejaculatory bulb-specific protein 3-like [Dinoponera quadriceps]|uniref:Ejaculatory bulb-specific protein 3-like n=1 Tax=Dinoponera quadriceps TaxID=609295 RepID=A0A6P3WN08_DINQU|nr:PREDICTED: ejaculatory bulb-specific protein 3-like [Dinoponera quadriceps]
MARLISIVAIIGIALVSVLTAEELYSDKYDDIDVSGILENERLRNEYYSCFMDQGPCPTENMKFYKNLISEAIVTKCQKCTEKQKENLDKVTDWYTQNKPEDWNAIVEKAVKDLKDKNA